jgi:flagellar hook-length control protein FliK
MSAPTSTPIGSMASAPEPSSAPAPNASSSSNSDASGPSFNDVLSQQTTGASSPSGPSNAPSDQGAANADEASTHQRSVTSSDSRRDPSSSSKSTPKEKGSAAPSAASSSSTATMLVANVIGKSVATPPLLVAKDLSSRSSSTPSAIKAGAEDRSTQAAPLSAADVTGANAQSVEQASAEALDVAEGSGAASYDSTTTIASSGHDISAALHEPVAEVSSGDGSTPNVADSLAGQVSAAVASSLTASNPETVGGSSSAKSTTTLHATAPFSSKASALDEASRNALSVAGNNETAHGDDSGAASRDATPRSSTDVSQLLNRTDGANARSSNSDFASALSSSRSSSTVVSASGLVSTASSFASSITGSSLDVDGLSGSISRPLVDGNGTYSVNVTLHPADLGRVQVVMSLDGNDLQVAITSQSQVGHAALTNSVDALKEQLSRGGMNVNVTLHDTGTQSGGSGRDHGAAPRSHSGDIDVSEEAIAPLSVSTPGQIHLVL